MSTRDLVLATLISIAASTSGLPTAAAAVQAAPLAPPARAQHSDEDYRRMIREYQEVFREIDAFQKQVSDGRRKFLTGIFAHAGLLGAETVTSEFLEHLLHNVGFASLALEAFHLAGELGEFDAELGKIEARLDALRQEAALMGLMDYLDRSGFLSPSNADLVFTWQAVSKLPDASGPEIVSPAAPAPVFGLTRAGAAALSGQIRLLKAAEATQDVVLKTFLVNAAASASHFGATPSYDPAYYQSMLSSYRAALDEYLTPLEEEKARIEKTLANTLDPAAAANLIGRLVDIVMVRIPEIQTNRLEPILAAMRPTGQPNPAGTYIPLLGGNATLGGESVAPIDVPSADHFARVGVSNLTGRELIVDFDGALMNLASCGTFSVDVVRGAHLIAAMVHGQGNAVAMGHSALRVDEGKLYRVSIALARNPTGRQPPDIERTSIGAAAPCPGN